MKDYVYLCPPSDGITNVELNYYQIPTTSNVASTHHKTNKDKKHEEYLSYQTAVATPSPAAAPPAKAATPNKAATPAATPASFQLSQLS